MGILRKGSDTPETPPVPARERVSAAFGVTQGDNGISIIGPGMSITGNLVTHGTVRIEGRVEGTIQAGKSVVLGRDGEVIGDIVTHDAILGGRVNGTVTAETRLELQSTSVIEGEIRAPAQHLKLEEGARFNGQIQMVDQEIAPIRAIPAETADIEETEGAYQEF